MNTKSLHLFNVVWNVLEVGVCHRCFGCNALVGVRLKHFVEKIEACLTKRHLISE